MCLLIFIVSYSTFVISNPSLILLIILNVQHLKHLSDCFIVSSSWGAKSLNACDFWFSSMVHRFLVWGVCLCISSSLGVQVQGARARQVLLKGGSAVPSSGYKCTGACLIYHSLRTKLVLCICRRSPGFRVSQRTLFFPTCALSRENLYFCFSELEGGALLLVPSMQGTLPPASCPVYAWDSILEVTTHKHSGHCLPPQVSTCNVALFSHPYVSHKPFPYRPTVSFYFWHPGTLLSFRSACVFFLNCDSL